MRIEEGKEVEEGGRERERGGRGERGKREREKEEEREGRGERRKRERERGVPRHLTEGNVKLGVFLRPSHDKLPATVVEREVAYENPALIQVLGAVHTAQYWAWNTGGMGMGH